MHPRFSNVAVALLALVVLAAQALGERWPYRSLGGQLDRQAKILEKLPSEPDLLINLDASDLPSTTDMIRLGRRSTPAVVNGLVNSMSIQVRLACAAVLTGVRDPAALDALLDALDDPSQAVRLLAMRALGSVESRKATGRLLAMVRDPRTAYALKREAVHALGRLGDPSSVKPLLKYFLGTWDASAQRALWDLRRHLSQRQLQSLIVKALVAAARGRTGKTRPPAAVLAFSIERAGELKMKAAVAPLRKIFHDHPGLQNRIVHALGRVGDRRARRFLVRLLDRTADARLLNNVTFALKRLGQDPTEFLAAALGDRRAYIRFNAAFVAGDLGERRLVPQLVVALGDRNDYVRSEAAVALGKIAAPEAVPALEKASEEANPIVRRDALLALIAIDYPRYRARIVKLVSSRIGSVRQKALEALAARGDESVVAPVIAALDASDYGDRALGITLLGRFHRLDNPDATAFLLRVAAEGGDRHQALVLLARFADPRARFVLRQWLTAPAGEQSQLLRAMGRYRDAQSRGLAERWLGGARGDVSAQLHAAFQLANLKEKAGANRLLAAIETAPVELKRIAARLLTELDLALVPGTREALAELLANPDVYVRLYAARALLEGGDARAARLLGAELAKRVPFIRDEVLDIVERAPAKHRDPLLRRWRKTADAHIGRAIDQILLRNG